MVGLFVLGVPVVFMVVGALWLIAWLLTEWPLNWGGIPAILIAALTGLIAIILIVSWVVILTKPGGFMEDHFPVEEVETVEGPRC